MAPVWPAGERYACLSLELLLTNPAPPCACLDELAEATDLLLQSAIGPGNVEVYLRTALRLIATRQLERACLLLRHGAMEGGASEFSSDEQAGLQAILNRLLDAPSVALILEDPLVLTEWLAENREELAALGGRLANLAALLGGKICHEQLGVQEAVAAELVFSHWPTTEEELWDLLSRLEAPETPPALFDRICLALLRGTSFSLAALRGQHSEGEEALLSLHLFTFHLLDLLWRAGLVSGDVHRRELYAYVKALASSYLVGTGDRAAVDGISDDGHGRDCPPLPILLIYADGLDAEVPSIVTDIIAALPLEALLRLNEQVSGARPSKRLIQGQLQARAFESWRGGDPVPALRMARGAQDRILEAAIVQAALQRYSEGSGRWAAGSLLTLVPSSIVQHYVDSPPWIDQVAEATAGTHYQQLISHARAMMEDQGGEGEPQAAGNIQLLVGSGALLPAPVAEAILERLRSLPPASLRLVHPLALLEFLERHQRRWVLDAGLVRAVRLLVVQGRFGPWCEASSPLAR